MNDEFRRNVALFPMGIVMKLSGLSARQIRYYEQRGLIAPVRTEGNQRLYSFIDIERLLEIKKKIEDGVNIAGIRQMLQPVRNGSGESADVAGEGSGKTTIPDSQLRRRIRMELLDEKRPGQSSLIQGELARFFHK